MKVIFLDIDGVLNIGKFRKELLNRPGKDHGRNKDQFGYLFFPEAVENLEYII